MATEQTLIQLPAYQSCMEALAPLALPISISELHGVVCGYLCAGAGSQAETYIRALATRQKSAEMRNATSALFNLFSISQQQIENFDFEFQLLLPEESEPLPERAKAFSDWCGGFIQGLNLVGIGFDVLHEEEAQDALQHIADFAELDHEEVRIGEEDERALMEVSEYTRMAVLRIHGDLLTNEVIDQDSGSRH